MGYPVHHQWRRVRLPSSPDSSLGSLWGRVSLGSDFLVLFGVRPISLGSDFLWGQTDLDFFGLLWGQTSLDFFGVRLLWTSLGSDRFRIFSAQPGVLWGPFFGVFFFGVRPI